MTNPYVTQIARQTGASEAEVRRNSRREMPTLDYVQARGFETVEQYLEALHEFMNGQ